MTLYKSSWRVRFSLILVFGAALSSYAISGERANHGLEDSDLADSGFAQALQDAIDASAPERDDRLRQIALEEAHEGRYHTSIKAVSHLSDDRQRSIALREIYGIRQGAQGGGTQADFDSLIDLVQSTIEPDSWEEVGTGTGSIRGFEGGVYIDSDGLLNNRPPSANSHLPKAIDDRILNGQQNRNPHAPSKLRKVSITRLEKQIQLRTAFGEPLDDAMRYLAGLRRIKYLFVLPERGELILAGPAGGWRRGGEDRIVSDTDGQPALRLQDLVVLLRNAFDDNGRFGCSITPRKDNLVKAQSFLNQSSDKPLKPGGRDAWITELRNCLGRQDIEVYGIDPCCRAAHVLVEADYHMKLIGMGLVKDVEEIDDYLTRVVAAYDEQLPSMDVLRWWFTLNYDSLDTNEGRDVFMPNGQAVRILSENELLTETGQRVHTGDADLINRQFAADFTEQFDSLAKRFPIYAELQNVFDLALIAALIRHEDLPSQVGWHMTFFGHAVEGGWPVYSIPQAIAPREVETIMNYRMLDQRSFVAGVSGGVTVDSASLLADTSFIQVTKRLAFSPRRKEVVTNDDDGVWWWD